MNDPIFNSLNSSVNLHVVYGLSISALIAVLNEDQKAAFRLELNIFE